MHYVRIFFGYLNNFVYIVATILLIFMSMTMMICAAYELFTHLPKVLNNPGHIINSISLIVISIAVYDVGKYLVEEEILREDEMRTPDEARKSLTKFLVILAIAVSLEALVYVFKAGKTDLTLLLYPSILLLVAITIVIGLGVYQKLSANTEKIIEDMSPSVIHKNQNARTESC